MTVELEFFTMRGHCRHDSLCCPLPALERGGSQNAAHDHARVHVPGLRLKTDLDGDAVFAGLSEQVIELSKRPHRVRAGRFKENLEHARPVAPDERISAPCTVFHTKSFLSVRSRSVARRGFPKGMRRRTPRKTSPFDFGLIRGGLTTPRQRP